MNEHCCAECRHWRESFALEPDGSIVRNDWNECHLLFVVIQHRWELPFPGRHYDKGDVITQAIVDRYDLLVDRLHTRAHFSCSGWMPRMADPVSDDFWHEKAA